MPLHLISRKQAANLGRDTVRIIGDGRYVAPSGAAVPIAEALRAAVEGTVSYPPDRDPPGSPLGRHATRFEVANESTTAAARRLVGDGHRVAALNFASAKNPGGGFLSGARAQEESLCRASGLSACLVGNAMYGYHRSQSDARYSDYVLYSPDVPVFRDDDGELLESFFLCSFLTSPAVNVGALGNRVGRHEVRNVMARRVAKVLAVAAHHGADALVLGAWGCGVFKNDPQTVAELFHAELTTHFQGVFARVVFAVLDWSDDRYFIGPFERLFSSAARD